MKHTLLLLSVLAALPLAAHGATPKAQTLKAFTSADSTLSKDLTLTEDKAWLANCSKAQIIHLFEAPNPNVEQCLMIYRAKLKTENLSSNAFLEMWCRFPGKGEFFSRGLQSAISGSNDWTSHETPFFLQKGEKPDLIKLNLVVNGPGKIWVKDVELLKSPLPRNK